MANRPARWRNTPRRWRKRLHHPWRPLKAYSLGIKTITTKEGTGAETFFQRAADLDPSFAMAYAWMAANYTNLNEVERGAENAHKAYDLREKVSERERFWIEGNYYMSATG